ncbi:MAG: aminopeptidase P family protein [Deltaproteobacteria bacterium]|nr:aminopeptidase P family protein [Deltaproteobacteria bacterium]
MLFAGKDIIVHKPQEERDARRLLMSIMSTRITPKEEIHARIQTLQKELARASMDMAIIAQNADLFYFSGTIQRGYLLVAQEGEPVFAATGDIGRIRQEAGIDKVECIYGLKDIPNLCIKLLSVPEHAITIGLEYDVLPVSLFKRFESIFPSAHFKDISSSIRKIRMVKSPYEVEKIRESASIFSDAMASLPKILKEGMTEVDLESEIIRIGRRRSHFGTLRSRGFNQETYYGHVISGPRGAIPSFLNSPTGGLGSSPAFGHGAGHWPIERNTPILIDLCFGVDGYLADQTRTAVLGRLPSDLERAYDRLLLLKRELEASLRPGAISEDIYHHALEKADALGIGEYFMGVGTRRAKFVGHGIGLEIDEWPVIGKGSQIILVPGMVIALEPKLIFPGIGAIGIEDNYVITETGFEKLTPLNESIIMV